MSSLSRWAAAVAAVIAPISLVAPVLAQQLSASSQEAPRCGGLFCDLYYSRNPPAPAGMPASAPAPGQSGSIFLPCHDFVCGMFGGRTPDQPVAVATEPVPTSTEPEGKPKNKRKHVAKANAKAVKAAEPAVQ